jgi:plastocyanin
VRSALRLIFFGSLSLPVLCAPLLQAQGVSVSAKILVRSQRPAEEARHRTTANSANVVVWLVPLQPADPKPVDPPRQTSYRLIQKNKQFSPHLLVIPTGTSVEFPNEDPFFHNVFSLFNGKRFDLGLYESGTRRSVRFDREGVSYIFCNIHPEMGAVVLALSTPYFGVSNADGNVLIHNVPVGSYRVTIWGETVQLSDAAGAQRTVQISTSNVNLGEITLQQTTDPMHNHKNKFGEDYPLTTPPRY